MEKAKELLENTTLKNYEIAEKVGFSDPHYFGISFKKMTGKTPTEYAREKTPMKISSKFKSIQSSIFCAVSILVLSAVLVVTVVSLRYTNSSIYENSVMYTQTIIKQLNQNIDSYISYMDNIASVIAQSVMLINICTVKKDMEP